MKRFFFYLKGLVELCPKGLPLPRPDMLERGKRRPYLRLDIFLYPVFLVTPLFVHKYLLHGMYKSS